MFAIVVEAEWMIKRKGGERIWKVDGEIGLLLYLDEVGQGGVNQKTRDGVRECYSYKCCSTFRPS